MTSAAHQKKEDPDTSQDPVEQLLGFLDSDRELARRKYERIRTRLTNLFRLKGCPAPAEYADRTIQGAARELIDGETSQITNPYLYFHRVAINVSNALKGSWAQTQTRIARPTSDHDAKRKEQRLLQCLRECLIALPPESLDLISKYHQPGDIDIKDARRELARSLGITPAALRLRAFNIRASLVRSVAKLLERSESSSPDDTSNFGAS